jgi:hypothetical protein
MDGKTDDSELNYSRNSPNLICSYSLHENNFLFVNVVPRYPNFPTFSKNLLAVSMLWFISAVKLTRHQQRGSVRFLCFTFEPSGFVASDAASVSLFVVFVPCPINYQHRPNARASHSNSVLRVCIKISQCDNLPKEWRLTNKTHQNNTFAKKKRSSFTKTILKHLMIAMLAEIYCDNKTNKLNKLRDLKI